MSIAKPVHFFDIDSILPGIYLAIIRSAWETCTVETNSPRAYEIMVFHHAEDSDGLELQKDSLCAELHIIS